MVNEDPGLQIADNTQPAFLRRLRGEITGGDSPRHEQPISRNKRLKQDDEDDAPTYVLEESNESVSKEEYDALVSGKDANDESQATVEGTSAQPEAKNDVKTKDIIAEVGAKSKKRKVAKIIGKEQDQSSIEAGEHANGSDLKVVKKSKKGKTVKLTFGDDI
jgi:hypothetical protein